MTRQLAVVALSCYAAGVGIGLIICNRAWITQSGETHYRLGAPRVR